MNVGAHSNRNGVYLYVCKANLRAKTETAAETLELCQALRRRRRHLLVHPMRAELDPTIASTPVQLYCAVYINGEPGVLFQFVPFDMWHSGKAVSQILRTS